MKDLASLQNELRETIHNFCKDNNLEVVAYIALTERKEKSEDCCIKCVDATRDFAFLGNAMVYESLKEVHEQLKSNI